MSVPNISMPPTRAYLEMLAQVKDVFLAGKWLLKHGRSFGDFDGELPAGVNRGMMKMCYWNSLQLARRSRGRFVYCEGLATNVLPVQHAWCYDLFTQRIVDVTWKNGCDYIGVPFTLPYAQRFMNLDDGDTPLMNMTGDFPVIMGVHGPEMWRQELP